MSKQIQKTMSYPVFIMTFHKLGLEIIKSIDPAYKILSNKRELIETIIKSDISDAMSKFNNKVL